jgi:hypothetical protein
MRGVAHVVGLTVFACSCTTLAAQLVLTPEYERLRRFEGTYEAERGGTLQILVSPRDSILVAAVGGGKYPLKALGGDLFMNGSGQRVQFSFEPGREIHSAEGGIGSVAAGATRN